MFWVSERTQGRTIAEDGSLVLDPTVTFFTYAQSLYITFISFFGVGYGEVSPDCDAGRLYLIFCCFMGATTTSLMIVNLMFILDPSNHEIRSMSVIERILYNEPMRKASALIIDAVG